jgi:hypothetical protein
MYEAKILKDSISERGVRLVTFEVNYPHAIHKDVMTHRWARNFQSFRAVPTEKLLARIRAGEVFRPERLSKRVKGMGRGIQVNDYELERANAIWDDHIKASVHFAELYSMMDIAKEQVNFLLQDLCFIRGIITTTMPQLENFFGLRLAKNEHGDPLARLEVYKIANMMYDAFTASTPQVVGSGAWHLPLVTDDEISQSYDNLDYWEPWQSVWDYWRKVSVGRCARVSYLTHDGVRDPEKDIALHDRLLRDGHMSPFEHQGTPIVPLPNAYLPDTEDRMMRENTGCFGYGWVQYRKIIPGENNYHELLRLNAGE